MSDKARIQAVYNARGLIIVIFFFFSSRRRHTRWTGDWSSDVALPICAAGALGGRRGGDHPDGAEALLRLEQALGGGQDLHRVGGLGVLAVRAGVVEEILDGPVDALGLGLDPVEHVAAVGGWEGGGGADNAWTEPGFAWRSPTRGGLGTLRGSPIGIVAPEVHDA